MTPGDGSGVRRRRLGQSVTADRRRRSRRRAPRPRRTADRTPGDRQATLTTAARETKQPRPVEAGGRRLGGGSDARHAPGGARGRQPRRARLPAEPVLGGVAVGGLLLRGRVGEALAADAGSRRRVAAARAHGLALSQRPSEISSCSRAWSMLTGRHQMFVERRILGRSNPAAEERPGESIRARSARRVRHFLGPALAAGSSPLASRPADVTAGDEAWVGYLGRS